MRNIWKTLKAYSGCDPSLPNIELTVHDLLSYAKKYSNFMFLDRTIFGNFSSYLAETHMDTRMHTQTLTSTLQL